LDRGEYRMQPQKDTRMQTLQELIEQKAALERQIANARNNVRSEALAEIRKLMIAHGLTAADLGSSAKASASASAPRRKVAPKYRDPSNGATWTGRGLKPKWLVEQLANGKRMSDFAI
jgi:DNA-binding protein H-NS